MERFVYILFLFFVNLVRIIPFRVLYIISDGLAFLMRYVVKYRYKVVYGNITKVFPQKSEKEKQLIIKKFYKHLTDIMIESVKGFTLNREEIIRRHKFTNPEMVEHFYDEGISVIGCSSHFSNWEWGTLSAGLQMRFPLVVFYKPLSNKLIDNYMQKIRAHNGAEMASINLTFRVFKKYEERTTAYMMVSDQNPGNADKAIWVNFFGIETAFLHGLEQYAVRMKNAVVYVDIRRVKRGFYTMTYRPIASPGVNYEPGKITTLFAGCLENQINAHPEQWLWSHRRWKYTREEVEARKKN